MKASICLKNGRVIDPSSGVDKVADISVAENKVKWGSYKADYYVDVSNCLVVPGLIDYHSHFFQSGWEQSLPLDLMFAQGVTGAVDAGSAGYENFDCLIQNVTSCSRMHTKTYLNISPLGMIDPDQHTFCEEKVLACLEKYRDDILGLKLLVSKGNAGEGENGLKPLEKVLAFIDHNNLNVRVCVHTTDCPVPAERLADMLRPGDVFCHCFQGEANSLLTKDGRVSDGIDAARKRGILFDAAPGRGNFSITVARAAMSAGFYPDIIGSDITMATANKRGHCKNLPYIISKFLQLGLPLNKAIACCTSAPAAAMNEEMHLGTLSENSEANITVLKVVESDCHFTDRYGHSVPGSKILMPLMTICSGNIVYCQNGFDD